MKSIGTFISYSILIILGIMTIFPFLYMISVGFMDYSEVTLMPPKIIPSSLRWQNFVEVFEKAPFVRYFLNTILVSSITTIATLITAVLAAFSLSTLTFRFKNVVISVMVSLLMVPSESIIFTNYNTIAKLGLLDSYAGLTLPFLTSIFYTYYLMSFLKSIPDTYYKAAKINGATDFEYIRLILIPMIKPALVTVGLLSFIASWNSFLWPLLVTNTSDYRLLNNGLSAFVSESGSETHLQMAAATITVLPILLIYFVFRKEIIKGVAKNGIKG